MGLRDYNPPTASSHFSLRSKWAPEKKLWTSTLPRTGSFASRKRLASRPPSHRKRWPPGGYKRVACLDEAGRGALCGPVVAAAAVIKNLKLKTLNSKQYQNSNFKCSKRVLNFDHLDLFRISNLEFRILLKEIKDSKKLSPSKREKLYRLITRSPFIEWGIGKVSEKVIDKINILEATKLAMNKAIRNLEKKYSYGRIRIPERSHFVASKLRKQFGVKLARLRYSHADFLIIDGNFRINLPIPQKSIIKADQKVFSCSAASIIAKVTRDRIMHRYHKKYPQYGFDKHKGYPTRFHLKMLKKYGPCKIHRKTFGPVKKLKAKSTKLQIKTKSY